MGRKKIFAIVIALFGLVPACLFYVNHNPGWFFISGIYACFTVSIGFYAFDRNVDGKKASFILTCLLSLWIGGYFFVLGIQEWPSMGGQALVFTGIFGFIAIWLAYAIVKWLISMLRKLSAGRSKTTIKNNQLGQEKTKGPG